MEQLQLVSSSKSFGGKQNVYSHSSSELKCKMSFSVYFPPQAEENESKLPVIFFLSGLTCTEQNFITKSAFQRYAAKHGIIVIGPDTSPRGVRLPGDDESWDFGVSAGFYLDASKEPWSKHYNMASYVNKELYDLVQSAFANVVDPECFSIMGHRYAAKHGIIVIGPDTSPRGVRLPGDDESWDFGVSAGFYLDASKEPWSKHYNMASYVNKELYDLVQSAFANVVDPECFSIMGHSMGGHGALISALRNPGLYLSASAFAPICNPSSCPWGIKAFTNYLGEDKTKWAEWDATELVKNYRGPPLGLYIDQGAADQFYKDKQLLPENFVSACQEAEVPVVLNLREGYDHSYYYIATFIEEHFDFHAKFYNK